MELKVTLIKSLIGVREKHRNTIASLGLRKISSSRTHTLNPGLIGKIKQVAYLVKVEEVR